MIDSDDTMPSPESPPDELVTIERAFSLVNEAMHAVALQRRRLAHDEPDDNEFVMRRWVDWEFFILALWRLRRRAQIAIGTKSGRAHITAAIQEFDRALPDLKLLRDVGEHIDAYAVDSPKRHQGHVSRRELQVGSFDGQSFTWPLGENAGGPTIDSDVALAAAERLYVAVQAARDNAKDPAR